MLTINCSCALLLFLMCFSLHACHARSRDIGVLVQKKQHHKLSHDFFFSNKIQGEISISKEKPGDQSKEKLSRQDLNKDKRSSNDHEMEGKNLKNEIESHVESMKSRASVTWRVPHRKRGEKQPGFNLDYSPPKTHPPSHN